MERRRSARGARVRRGRLRVVRQQRTGLIVIRLATDEFANYQEPTLCLPDLHHLGDPGELETLVKGAGFLDVQVEELAILFRAPDIDAHVARVSSLAGPLAAVLQAASPEQRAALRRTAADLASPFVTDDGLEIPGRALLVSGRR